MASPISFNVNIKDKSINIGSGNDKVQIGKDGVSIAGIPIIGKKLAQTGDKPVLGPLSKLDLNKYASGKSLQYPLDIAGYKHWVRFNINVQEGSKYNKKTSGGTSAAAIAGGVANANRALTNQLGGSKDAISTGGSIATGVVAGVAAAAGGVLKGLLKGSKSMVAGSLAKGVGIGAASGFIISDVDVSAKTSRVAQSIFLYIPDTIQSQMVNQYDAVSLTEVMGGAGLAAQGAEAVGTSVKELMAKMGGAGGGKPKEGSRGATGARMEAEGAAAEKLGFGAGIKDVLLQSKGLAINPQIEILYKAISNREFQFDFKFTPSSQKEAEEVLNIIRAFRFHAAPELLAKEDSSRYLIPPSQFDIEFCFDGKQNPALHKISTCVLEGIDVNYVTAGQFATYEDGMPIEIAMQLRFKEIELLHKDLIKEGY